MTDTTDKVAFAAAELNAALGVTCDTPPSTER